MNGAGMSVGGGGGGMGVHGNPVILAPVNKDYRRNAPKKTDDSLYREKYHRWVHNIALHTTRHSPQSTNCNIVYMLEYNTVYTIQ